MGGIERQEKYGFSNSSERHGNSKLNLFVLLASKGEGDPRAEVAFETGSLRPVDQVSEEWDSPGRTGWKRRRRNSGKRGSEKGLGTGPGGPLDLAKLVHREMMIETATEESREQGARREARRRS